MRFRSLTPFACLISSIACASSGGPPTDTQRVILTDDQIYRTSVSGNAKTILSATPDQVWTALGQVYAGLGVEVATLDRANGRIGNAKFYKSRRMAGESISAFLNCGDTFSGPAANVHRIHMSLISTVRPGPGGKTELETSFNAEAQSMEGASSDRLACGTTGVLEERIRKAVEARLGG